MSFEKYSIYDGIKRKVYIDPEGTRVELLSPLKNGVADVAFMTDDFRQWAAGKKPPKDARIKRGDVLLNYVLNPTGRLPEFVPYKLAPEDWLEDFYPSCANSEKATKSAKAAVKHSLRKWRGMTTKVLARYNLKREGRKVLVKDTGDLFVIISSDNCALCMKYDVVCGKCPLTKTNPDYNCDREGSPYRKAVDNNAVSSMIQALEETLAYVKNKS